MEVQTESMPQKNAAELRRELRRKKILCNAENRLQKLIGGTVNESQQPKVYDDVVQANDADITPSILTDPSTIFEAADYPQELTTVSEQNVHPLFRYKIHVIIPAVIIYLYTLHFCEEQHKISLLLPCIISSIMEMYFNRNRENSIMPLEMALGLFKINFKGLKYIAHIRNVVSDIALIIFMFCIITYMLTFVNSNFLNLIQTT
ncbi:uncharacterized protein LOC119688914 [Teleopsis dalmanni]|uniref:uncharacterized protein LOC119688914 n=1 Tax=Teleopsis dalmanni TaxID=139649 RepID=UPI0018CF6C37|nr:uncharacterized protein LOC119688914 [Teleopsis dalmanni]